MLLPRGKHHQRLRAQSRLGFRVQQNFAQSLADRRTARLAGEQYGKAVGFEPLADNGKIGRFARTIYAVQSDKFGFHKVNFIERTDVQKVV